MIRGVMVRRPAGSRLTHYSAPLNDLDAPVQQCWLMDSLQYSVRPVILSTNDFARRAFRGIKSRLFTVKQKPAGDQSLFSSAYTYVWAYKLVKRSEMTAWKNCMKSPRWKRTRADGRGPQRRITQPSMPSVGGGSTCSPQDANFYYSDILPDRFQQGSCRRRHVHLFWSSILREQNANKSVKVMMECSTPMR